MHKSNKKLFLTFLILVLTLSATSAAVFARPNAATSPTLDVLLDFSVLGGAAVTNTGDTETSGAVGVSPDTSITGFPPGTAGGGLHENDQTAIDAQAEASSVFDTLDQGCDETFGGGGLAELGGRTLVPGVYCAESFQLTGTLTLTGGAGEVYIFKTASTLEINETGNVVGGDPCNVWWRVGSSSTHNAGSSLIGNVFSQTGTSAMQEGATLNGRLIGLSPVTVTLINNTISGPDCLVAPTPEPTEEPTPEPTEEPTEEPSASTPEPEALPDTGGDLEGPGTQTVRISLGALGLSLLLVGFILSRRTQKSTR